jgi:hypothetical protein
MKNHLKILAALLLTVALVCAACKKDPDNGGNNNGNEGENPQSFTVSISANPSEGGSVSGGGNFEEGQSCTVIAVPASDYTFTHWTEDGSQVSDAASYTFVVTSNRTLVANFVSDGGGNGGEEPQYCTVSLSVFPENSGTVTGSGSYLKGSTCTITATPGSGYTFVTWADEINEISVDASYTFTVTGDRNLTALFAYDFQGPTGAIKGQFSVNDNGDMVYFSQGNLQYNPFYDTWRFAEHQWDYVGGTYLFHHYGNVDNCSNNDVSPTYEGWMDLFGWGTSGWDNGNTYYQPWEVNNDWYIVDDEYVSCGRLYGPPGRFDLTGNYANSDWGHYNTISNGDGRWRTLTIDEWGYVFNLRSTDSGIRYARAQLRISNGEIIDGIILLPDDWNEIYYMLYDTNNASASYESNVIMDWSIFEAHGAVFLPPTGTRGGLVYLNSGNGCYWSASCSNSDKANAYSVFFDSYSIGPWDCDRMDGRAVRLVSPAEN